VLLWEIGKSKTAADFNDRAIRIFEHLVNQSDRPEWTDRLAAAYLNKASHAGKDQSALDLCEGAIMLFERLVKDEGRSELRGDLAWVHALKAGTLYNLGEPKKAKREFKKALPVLREEVKRTNRADLLKVLKMAEAFSEGLA
jgi:tetratricopeptide (TPR) repeat protein